MGAVDMPEAPQSEAPWLAQGEAKREAVQQMFADIAPSYDVCNSLMSARLHHRWRAAAVAKLDLKTGSRVADVCCGTGDFFRPLRRAIGERGVLLGVDFCLPMLALAGNKDVVAGRAVGDACRLPVRAEAVDGVTVGWGMRNVPDIDLAHREIARILKAGGRFVSLDMAVPRNGLIRLASRVMSHRVLPVLGSLFGQRKAYTYLPQSTDRFQTREALVASMERAGFVEVGFRDLFFGNICMHWGTKR